MKEQHWNLLTILVLISILLLIGFISILFSNPYSGLNPFPPPPLPDRLILPTATATYLQLPPTWTFTPESMRLVPSLLPSSTLLATFTDAVLPTATVTVTPTATNTITYTPRPTRTTAPTETKAPAPKPTNTPVPPTNAPTSTPELPTQPPAE
jgi:hypothetical protein